MAVTATPYGQFLQDLLAGVHNVSTDTDKVALLTSAYTPDFDANASFADVSANEVSGSGYTAGGIALANKAIAYNTSTNVVSVNADAVSWTGLAVTTRYAVIYRSSNTNANSKLIGLIDFGADRTYDTETFQLSFPNGVVNVSAA
jgi:hypothetical protein